MRKNHPAFRIPKAESIRKNLNFCIEYNIGVVSYCIEGKACGDSWSRIMLIFNGNLLPMNITLPEGNYTIVAKGGEIREEGFEEPVSGEVAVDGISMLMLVAQN